MILDSWVLDNFVLANEWFAKSLRRVTTCLTVNKNLCQKQLSLLPVIFDDNFKVTSLALLVVGFSLSSCISDSFTVTLLYYITLSWYCILK